jgi:ribulose 1,5-bisphosphate carboxylase large subunit-like protein
MLKDLLYGQAFRVFSNRKKIVQLTGKSFLNNLSDLGEKYGRHWFSVKIPGSRLEFGGLTGILTQLWGNVLDYGEFCLEAIDERLIEKFLKPRCLSSRFHQLDKADLPFLAAVLKPSYHLTTRDRVKIAADFVRLGGDFIKEDETYFPSFKQLEEEVSVIQGYLDSITAVDRGLGIYVPNISGIIHDTKSIEILCHRGMKAAMVNFLIVGFQTVQKIAFECASSLFLWGHRVGFKNMQNTFSILSLIQFSIASGLNAVHVGTPLLNNQNHIIRAKQISSDLKKLKEKMGITFFPVITKITQSILPGIIEIFGNNCILVGCGEFIKGPKKELNLDKINHWIKEAKTKGGARRN